MSTRVPRFFPGRHVLAHSIALGPLLVLALALTACSGGNAVPADLNDIEEQAEDIIDIVLLDRWPDVATDVEAIRGAWSGYTADPPDGLSADLRTALESNIAKLEAAAGASLPDETMQAANDLSSALFDLFALYDLDHPIAISRLDVVGRQIILDIYRGDAEGARTQVDLARSTFEAIRTELAGREGDRGTEVVANTERSLAAMDAALDPADAVVLVTEANVFLELVDDMERLY